MKPRLSFQLFNSIAVTLLLACTRASTPLPKAGGKPLAAVRTQAAPAEGFAVVFAGPSGETAPESEVQLVFSRPLRAMTSRAEAPTPPIHLRPNLAGTWRWLGTQALVFSPAQRRLPFGTAIEVEVSAELRALDGTPLGKPYQLRFNTPAPKLVDVDSADDDAMHLRSKSWFTIRLDQPVRLEALESKLSVNVELNGKTESYPFRLEARREQRDRQAYRLTPKREFPRAAVVKVVLAAGFVGLEGPLGTKDAQQHEFATVSPLRVDKVDCERSGPRQACDSRSGIDLEFNNPVPIRELRSQLMIDGKRAKLASWHTDEDVSANVHLPGPFRPGSTISLRVGAAAQDNFGQRLERPYVERIGFDDLFPSMEIGLQGDVFETSQPGTIPIGVVNVERYERLYLPLTRDGLVAMLTTDDSDALFERGLAMPGVELARPVSTHGRNQLGVESFEPGGKLGPALGAALIAVRYPGFDREGKAIRRTDARLVQRTNLGISGEVGRHASALWITELDSGHSVPNAEVVVLESNGKIRARSTANAEGVARLGPDAIPPDALEEPWKHQAAIVVSHGADWAFRRISDLLPEWRIPVSVDRSGDLGQRVMLFTERGLYRPGERVDVKAVIRDEQARGLTIAPQRAYQLELWSPDNHAVATTTAKASEFGTVAAHFAIPLAARTGQWSVRASLGKKPIGSTELTVGEYRPVELEVAVVPAVAEMIRGGKLTIQVQSKTLFGMAAAGAKARLEAYRERTHFVPRGAEAYVTDADEYEPPHRDDNFQRAQLLLSQAVLDKQGRTEATVSAELPAARGPEWISLEAEVTDAGQNPVAASARTLVHPATQYLGLRRLNQSWITAPNQLSVEVAAFAVDGTRRADRLVELELVRRQWSVVRREVNGAIQSRNEPSDEIVGRCSVKTAATDKRCTFEVARSGSYFVLARGKDEQQRMATAAQAFVAVGAGIPDFPDSDERRIEIVPDKPQYRIGDVAKLLVKTPLTDSDALIVVGRSDVHSVERRHLTGQTPILEIPILADMRPNLYVSVHLVTARKRPPPAQLERPDPGAPTYRMGWAELKIDTSDRRLALELKPSARVTRPGAEVELAVTLRDGESRPLRGEVTLWAVDEGVLALGNYQVPDPLQIFLGSRPLQLLPLESRESLGRRTLANLREELGLTKGSPGSGGGETGSGSALRKDFRATAFFRPDLVTDAQGQARATFRLPDGLTSYRVFGVAVSGTEQFGFASDRIVTQKPLMVRPTLPRFFRDGDRADLGVAVASADVPDGDASVTMTTSGLSPKSQKQTARLARGESTELFFPVVATSDIASSIRFDAVSGAFKDSVLLTRPLRESLPMEVVAQSGETQESVLEKIGALADVRPDRGYLELQLSNSFLGGAAGGFQQLVEYPYGCSEQIASRLMALLPLAELAKSAGIELPKDRNQLVEVAIAELLRRQRSDGGFGMWSGAEHSEPWVSAHVLATLNEAKAGRSNLLPALERGADYLHSLAAGFAGVEAEPVGLASMPYVADVLFRLGKGDPGLLSRLFGLRERMPLFSQAMLLHAYALSHHDPQATAQILTELERFLHNDGASARVVTNVGNEYTRLFDSNTRTGAIVLWAMAAAKPDHPMLVALARGILAERRDGRWATTQDSAFALLALDAVRRQKHLNSSGIEAKVSLGGRTLFAGSIGGKSRSTVTERVGLASLTSGSSDLLFEAQDGPLLYEVKLHYVLKEAARTAVDAGFGIERQFSVVGLDGSLASPLAAAAEPCVLHAARGQSFVVEIAVVVPRPRDFVVVDAPLPAGFEAIDVSQQTSSGWMQKLDRVEALGPAGSGGVEMHRDIRDDRVSFLIDHFPIGLYQLRYLVRAVTKGVYALPPARVEAMYAPEHFGATTACRVEIE